MSTQRLLSHVCPLGHGSAGLHERQPLPSSVQVCTRSPAHWVAPAASHGELVLQPPRRSPRTPPPPSPKPPVLGVPTLAPQAGSVAVASRRTVARRLLIP